jgi:catechol 2,3-dioxygenase-like lactoylglutathione lyase family enzyme
MAKIVPELYCSDYKNSLKFYTDVLGFRVRFDRPDEGFAFLEREGAELMLDAFDKTRTWLKAPLEYPWGRGINLQIEVGDVEKLYETAKQNRCEIFMEIETKWYRCGAHEQGNRQFIVCDPDGYLLRFFEDLGTR